MCHRCVPTITTCGVCGRVARIILSATADRPAVGSCCYQAPVGICSRCGMTRPCYHADTDRAVCMRCTDRPAGECGVCGQVTRIARRATDTSPAVGICCYELPLAVCSDCGREKPCYHAKSPEPVCPSCTAVRRAPICVDCGQRRVAHRRVEGGVICGPCDLKRGGTTAACGSCGLTAPLIKGLCAACQLRERVAELAASGDPTSAVTLAPFLRSLAVAENPLSAMRWFYTPGFEITRRLLAGEIPVTHHGLDEAAIEFPNPVAFVRAALVDSGVLAPRDEYSARFASWHAQVVRQIAAGPDRAHVRAYASWQVAHKLATGAQRRGEPSYASLKWARSLVTEAIKLVLWLHEQQLELTDLRQDLVDQWVSQGGTTRRRVRLFLTWLQRAGAIGQLHVAWDDRLPGRPALDDEERFAILRRLLHDSTIDLRDRFAGSLLLLYGKPITRIAALRTTSISVDHDSQTTLQLGRGGIPLPEPLGAIALALRYQQRQRTETEGWLFPGRHAGTHIAADTLRGRLKRYGIDRSREGRNAALLALAGRLPAPILAERIGIHQARAAQWVRLAGATYADYVATRHTVSEPPPDVAPRSRQLGGTQTEPRA